MRPSPILVTGAPRSGTTWLARQLADSPGTALAGREPMNARRDSKHWYNPTGRQYALAGTLDGWTRLTQPTTRQERSLRRAYSGLHPLLVSKYGHKQWRALRPTTRIVVKDPFALLSVPAIQQATDATAVVVVRHPGAILASYRRMGWGPDISELTPIVLDFIRDDSRGSHLVEPPAENMDALTAMGWFWNSLYGMALADSRRSQGMIFVSHSHLASTGERALAALRATLDLRDPPDGIPPKGLGPDVPAPEPDQKALHNFDRDPALVADAWKHLLSDGEREQLEGQTAALRQELAALTSRVVGHPEHDE